jgi:hypothetical protein
MKRLPVCLLGAFGACLLATSTMSAQAPAQGGGGRGGPQAAPITNLQILPKEQFQTFQQVLPVMQNFSAALGVGCGYCHSTYIAPGNPMNDFASDTKVEKQKARVMMRTVRTVNTTFGTEIPAVDKTQTKTVQVGCVTCHRGVAIPRQLVDIVVDTGNEKGAAAAVAQYRDLRKQYYGAQAYDFSDTTLFTAAQRSNVAMKPDDAIAYAQLNLEFNPMSARSYQVMSQAYGRKMDTPAAITAMEKAVAMDPMNMGFQNQLNQLKKVLILIKKLKSDHS